MEDWRDSLDDSLYSNPSKVRIVTQLQTGILRFLCGFMKWLDSSWHRLPRSFNNSWRQEHIEAPIQDIRRLTKELNRQIKKEHMQDHKEHMQAESEHMRNHKEHMQTENEHMRAQEEHSNMVCSSSEKFRVNSDGLVKIQSMLEQLLLMVGKNGMNQLSAMADKTLDYPQQRPRKFST